MGVSSRSHLDCPSRISVWCRMQVEFPCICWLIRIPASDSMVSWVAHRKQPSLCTYTSHSVIAFVPVTGMRLVGIEPTPSAWKAEMLTVYTSTADATDGIRTHDERLRTSHDYHYTTVARKDASGIEPDLSDLQSDTSPVCHASYAT